MQYKNRLKYSINGEKVAERTVLCYVQAEHQWTLWSRNKFSFRLALPPGMQGYTGHGTRPSLVVGQICEFQCMKIAVWYCQHI